MGSFALLALLGMSVLFTVGGSDDTPEEPETRPEEPETPTEDPETPPEEPEAPTEDPETPAEEPVEGEMIALNGDATVTGTDGDDTLTADPNNPEDRAGLEALDTLNAGAGDDLIQITGPDGTGIEINGEAGNDTIVSSGLDIVINGGAGNDEIVAGSADGAFGGEGDDTLSYRQTANSDSTARLDGGEGNDRLEILEILGHQPDDGFTERGGVRYIGGEGDDTFALTLRLSDYADSETPTGPLQTNLQLDDFVAGEDTLEVDVQRVAGEEGRLLESAEIFQRSVTVGDEVTTYSELVMRFAASETGPAVVSTVRFGDPDVTLDDVTIANSTAPVIPEPEGELIELNGQTSVIGTAGDDTLNIDFTQNAPNALVSANLADGDDLIAITGQPASFGVSIDAGAGNDTIIGDTKDKGPGSRSTFSGGAGGDSIVGMPNDALIGGEGNDTLSMDLRKGSDHSSQMTGGAGDDTYRVFSAIGADDSRTSDPYTYIDMNDQSDQQSGQGADTLIFDLSMRSFGTDNDFTSTGYRVGAGVSGFDRENDTLVIEIERDGRSEGRDMTSAEFVSETRTNSDGETYVVQDLVMQFAGTDTELPHTTSIRFVEADPLRIEDVVFVQN